jgi:hypothetical protein
MDESNLRVELESVKTRLAEMEEERRVDRASQLRTRLQRANNHSRVRLLLFCAALIIPTAVYAAKGGTPLSSNDTLPAHDNGVNTQIAALAAEVDSLKGLIATLQEDMTAVQGEVLTNASSIGDHATDITGLEQKTKYVSVSGTNMYVTGANLSIRNGAGRTPYVNGLGNLIVGYNEVYKTTRTGSHNLVIGSYNSYTSYGGLVAGSMNTVSGIFSSVSGGYKNEASGKYSSVTGGYSNLASGSRSNVSGGYLNLASGTRSSVSGGINNLASGVYSSVGGGNKNTASGTYATVTGGSYNIATGNDASVTGGRENVARGHSSSISGGYTRETSGNYDWTAGSLFEDE